MRLLRRRGPTGLHSFGKGANRTPPDRAAMPPHLLRRGPLAAVQGCLHRPTQACLTGRQRERGRRHDGSFELTATTVPSAEHTRRDFIYIATGAVGAVGVAAVAWPLIAQMNPDASTIAAGAPIEVDLTPIAEGQVIKVFWRGRPIFISHRTKAEIDEA